MAYTNWRTISIPDEHKKLLSELGNMFDNIPEHLIVGVFIEKLQAYIDNDKQKLSDFIYGKEKITI